jgi:hypothetical protein
MKATLITLLLFCIAGVCVWYFSKNVSKLLDTDNDNDLG